MGQCPCDLGDGVRSEILGHLGDDLGFGFLCKLAPEIAENLRRRHDHKLVERAGQGNLIDPVCDRSSETFLFEFVPVRLSNGAANLADASDRSRFGNPQELHIHGIDISCSEIPRARYLHHVNC